MERRKNMEIQKPGNLLVLRESVRNRIFHGKIEQPGISEDFFKEYKKMSTSLLENSSKELRQ